MASRLTALAETLVEENAMKLIRNAIVLGLCIGAASMAGCSSNSPKSTSSTAGTPGAGDPTGITGSGAPAGPVGTVGLRLILGPGITLSTVQYVITNPTLAGFTTISGSLDVSGSQTISFSRTLPAGTGYTLSLSAADSNGDSCSAGPVSFSITAGVSSTVGLTLLCSRTIDGGFNVPDVNNGSLLVTADASLVTTVVQSNCAAVASWVAVPNETGVGNSLALTATGVDSAYVSSDVTLTWGASGGAGTLTGTTGASNTFNCTAAGTETITVTAAISNGGASCPVIGSAMFTLTCDADAGAVDAGIDTGIDTGIDAGIDTGVDTGIDVGIDTGTEASSGPLVPCTTVGQTNCAQCSGNTNGLCTTEEAFFVQMDITNTKVTAPGPIDITAATSSCYSCLVNNSAIDGNGTTGVECGDLPGTFINGSGATVPGPATCEAVIECIASSTGNHCSKGNAGVGNDTFCYCGVGGYNASTPHGPPSCQAAAGSALNGNCLTQELAGFASTTPATNFAAYASSALPSGMANQMIESARDTVTKTHCSALCGF